MLTAEQQKIVEDNINLVYSIAHKYHNQRLFDDMIQEGCIGLIKAVERFDTNLGIKFSTFAYYYISGYINMFLRRDCVIKPVTRQAKVDMPDICELPENVAFEENYDNIDTFICNDIFNAISDFQKFILVMLKEGFTQEDIAAATGKTQCKISQELQAVRNNPTVLEIASKFYSEGELLNGRRTRSKS